MNPIEVRIMPEGVLLFSLIDNSSLQDIATMISHRMPIYQNEKYYEVKMPDGLRYFLTPNILFKLNPDAEEYKNNYIG